jgi:hypothetical protein
MNVRPQASAEGYHWQRKKDIIGGHLDAFLQQRPRDKVAMEEAAANPVAVTPPVQRLQITPATDPVAASSTEIPATTPRGKQQQEKKTNRKTIFPFQGAKCCACQKSLGLLATKANCHSCHQAVCSKCSRNKIPLPQSGDPKPQMVCDVCYRLILNTLSAT